MCPKLRPNFLDVRGIRALELHITDEANYRSLVLLISHEGRSANNRLGWEIPAITHGGKLIRELSEEVLEKDPGLPNMLCTDHTWIEATGRATDNLNANSCKLTSLL